MYIGSWKIDDLLTFVCNTHTPSTGAATDADSAPSYRVYEDETGTPILTGTMALLDGSNTAGFYSEQITLSAANGLEKGKSYNIYISATVGGVTGTMAHTFQIEAEVDANTVSDKTGYGLANGAITAAVIATGAVDADALASDAVTEIQSAILSDATPFPGARIDATISSRSTYAGGAVASVTGNVGGNVVGSVGSVASGGITAASIATDAIDADAIAASAVTEIQSGLSTLDAAGVRTAVGLASANLDTQLTAIDDAIDTEVAAILAAVDTEVAAIKAKTDNLPASPAAVGSAMTLTSGERTSIADAILTRDWTAVSGAAARSLLNAGRFLRNKWSVIAGVLTVTEEDDTTTAWTATVTSDASADPVIGSDPT